MRSPLGETGVSVGTEGVGLAGVGGSLHAEAGAGGEEDGDTDCRVISWGMSG